MTINDTFDETGAEDRTRINFQSGNVLVNITTTCTSLECSTQSIRPVPYRRDPPCPVDIPPSQGLIVWEVNFVWEQFGWSRRLCTRIVTP